MQSKSVTKTVVIESDEIDYDLSDYEDWNTEYDQVIYVNGCICL